MTNNNHHRNPRPAPSSTGATCSTPCARPNQIHPVDLQENNVLFVRCEALRNLARDGGLELPQASIDVVTDVLSDLREYGGVDDISCRGVRWPLATGDSRPWLVIEGPVESLRRLFALKWFMGSRHIYNLTVIPWLQGHVIALLLASGDPHTVYDLVVDTRPHVIEVDKGGIVKAISYLYPTGTSLEELERLGKALTAKLANVFDLDVMKVEIRDVTAQFFQPNLGPLHVYDEPDRRTHAAPIKSRNLIVTRAYFSNHPAESSTSPSPLLPASSTDPSLSRKRRLDDVDEAESAPLPKRPELTGDDMAVNTPPADLARPPAVSTTAEVRERLVSSSLQLQPTSGEKRARVDDDDDDEGQSVKWTSAAMLRGRAIQLGEAAKLYEHSAMMVDEANELCKQADQKLEGLCGL